MPTLFHIAYDVSIKVVLAQPFQWHYFYHPPIQHCQLISSLTLLITNIFSQMFIFSCIGKSEILMFEY